MLMDGTPPPDYEYAGGYGGWLYIYIYILKTLIVLYESALISRLRDESTILFSLKMTIGSVILISSISLGAILAFGIGYISLAFQTLDVWVAARQAWWLVSCSGG